MKLENFYALHTGQAPLYGEERSGFLNTVSLGTLSIASGRVGLSDGAAFEVAASYSVPPGSYEVVATQVDLSSAQDASHMRTAYLSLVISTDAAVTLRESGETVPVDTGTVALFDALAMEVASGSLSGENREKLFDAYCNELDADTPLPAGVAFPKLPATDGSTFAFVGSGWGDGVYSLLVTEDAEGRITGLHLDLRVVGVLEPTPEDSEEPLLQPEAEATKPITTHLETVVPQTPGEVDKLIKRIKNYRGFWIPFLPIGIVFVILGMTTPIYYGVGLPFLVLAISYSVQETKDRARLAQLGMTKAEIEHRLNQ
jgi:hypothetical protein